LARGGRAGRRTQSKRGVEGQWPDAAATEAPAGTMGAAPTGRPASMRASSGASSLPPGTNLTGGNLDFVQGMNGRSDAPKHPDPPFNSRPDHVGPRGTKVAGAAFKGPWGRPADGPMTGEDKTMETIKSMGRLGLVLLVLSGTAAASAEDGPYWAVAQGYEPIGEIGPIYPAVYGAAWNFASPEDAENAAMEQCRKHTPERGCEVSLSGENSCFAIIRVVWHDRHLGSYTSFGGLGPSSSRAEANADATLAAADAYSNNPYVIDIVGTVELVECAGVQ
ncbi:MAG: DUF4189 domain-containing protein, partial [Boseongicola sp.]|nr:DUF4189 domain-containing protein [Boseongicola sp.]